MDMNNGGNLIQKIERFLGQHEEMYGNVTFEIQDIKTLSQESTADEVVDDIFDPLSLTLFEALKDDV